MPRTLKFSISWLLYSVCTLSGYAASGQTPDVSAFSPRRVKISEVATSSLVAERAPVKYPEAARASGVQGTVVLDLVVTQTGDVKDVSVVSGNPDLAKAATDAVRQWRYKPYTIDGVPVEMETQVTIAFNLRPQQLPEPSLGSFRDGTYRNQSFDVEYPLSRDWVRETQLMRTRYAASGPSPATYVLLAAVHIPQRYTSQEADSSFVLAAFESNGRTCEQHLQGLADEIHSQKQGQKKGTVARLDIAGREFYRADFDFRETPNRRTFLCTKTNGYFLQWNIVGLFNAAVESAIATINAIQRTNSGKPPALNPGTAAAGNPTDAGESEPRIVRVSQGVTRGMKIKDVAPIYPPSAIYAHIKGSVTMRATINKNGEIADLEVLDGPIELVVSAVNAVRLWKYRPYILKGESVEVDTTITVNYTLSGG